MAGREGGGMTSFVHKNNADPHGTRQHNDLRKTRSNDDLKVAVAKTTTANTRQTRSGVPPQSNQSRVQVDSREVRRNSNDGKPFYGTDASIDGSSVTSSARNGRHVVHETGQQRPTNGHAMYGDAASSGEGSEHGSGSDDFEDDPRQPVPNNPFGSMGPGAIQKLAMHEPNGAHLPHMKGDTYPSTTSGNPSVADQVETKPREKKHQTTAQSQSRGRQPLPTAPSIPADDVQDRVHPRETKANVDHGQSMLQDGLLARPQNVDIQSVQQHAGANFSFGKASKTPMVVRSGQKQQGHAATDTAASLPTLSRNTAHQGTTPTANAGGRTLPQQTPRPTQSVGYEHEPSRDQQHHHRKSKSRKQAQPPAVGHQRQVDRAGEHEYYSDSNVNIDEKPSVSAAGADGRNGAIEPDPNAIDYDLDTLLTMDYQGVKEQSFDIDPTAEDFKFPEEQSITDLNSKLDAAAALPQKHQFDFFVSLSLDEWEQAGDWFIGQFGNVLNKFKTNRQGTRDAAKTFEDEIEKRHVAVSKKRKQIENELSEMKESGGKVLQGTPKKAKTK